MIIGIDMGGTHIDGVVFQDGEIIKTTKKPTDKTDVLNTVWSTIKDLLNGLNKEDISRINLSTTVSTNAIVEDNISKVGMILQTGPGMTYDFSDTGDEIFYISGYLDHRGKMVKELDFEEIEKIKSHFLKEDIEAIGVVTKFSTRNPSHEIIIKEKLEESFDNITLGHSMSGKLNFPRRVRTSFLNAAVSNIFTNFAKSIKTALEKENIQAPVYVLKADGGTMSLEKAIEMPVETILSGPAASFMGMSALLETKEDSVLLDIGGTTTDIFFLVDGVPVFEPLGIEIDGYKTLVRSIYSKSIGIGGDSYVRIKNGELLIGPERKGKPIGFGGKHLTPTDAMIALDILEEGDKETSVQELKLLGKELNMDVETISWEIINKVVDDIYREIETLLEKINSNPVYTVKELLKDDKIIPKNINIIGGPAKAFSKVMKNRKGIDISYPKNYQIANAIGAALAKPTVEINMLADTDRKILSVPEVELYEPISSSYNLEEAEKRAIDIVEKAAIELGADRKNLKGEIIESSSFNMVKGFFGSSKNIRVRAQVKPGLIYDIRGEKNES